jgi:hypothetical protein
MNLRYLKNDKTDTCKKIEISRNKKERERVIVKAVKLKSWQK